MARNRKRNVLGALIAAVLLSSKALQPVLQIGGLLSRFALAKELSRLSGVFNRVSAEEARRQNISIKSITASIILDAVEFVPQGLNRSLISVERLRIKHGEKVGIIGSVGSGKSTFLKLIAGVLTPTSGQIRFGILISIISQSDLDGMSRLWVKMLVYSAAPSGKTFYWAMTASLTRKL